MHAATVLGSSFPRAARLKTPREFEIAFQQGRRIPAAAFRLHVRRDESAGSGADDAGHRPVRLGISVPKRVAARAVERNRIRRIVRESFRLLCSRLPAGDYVIVAQREAADAPAAWLREALDSLWRRVGALKPAGPAPTMPVPAPESADPDPPPAPDRPR